ERGLIMATARWTFGGAASRRTFLRVGFLGGLGLSLGDWMRLRAIAGPKLQGTNTNAKARACILIWLAGGPSHIDTFDPKPDAPADVKGEFRAIETTVPGLRISEVFPNLARMMDRVT